MARNRFTSLALNVALAALPVATYLVTESALRAVDALTEPPISDASGDVPPGPSKPASDRSEDPSPAPASVPGPASLHRYWLKTEPFELSLRTSRIGRPGRMGSGPSDGLLPPPADLTVKPAVPGSCDLYGPAFRESVRLVRLAPAILAHAPPAAA